MKRMTWLAVYILLGCGVVVHGTNLYVSLTGTSASPYTNWAGAATNIQDAVNVASTGDIIWITNGTYTIINQVSIAKAITLEGFNGSRSTFINGNYPQTTNRCFYMTNALAIISGLTISNGYAAGLEAEGTNGGGVYVAAGLIRDCVVSNNTAQYRGGGVYLATGIITNSTITRNCALNGGGLACYGDTKVQNCTISLNYATNSAGGILTIYLAPGPTTVENCMISNNYVVGHSGGGAFQHIGTLRNCVIIQNTVAGVEGAGGGVRLDGAGTITIEDCLFINNRCTGSGSQGGAIWSWSYPVIRNCTVVSNSAASKGGGIYLHENSSAMTVINTIIYSNTAASYANYSDLDAAANHLISFTNCCTMPLPSLGADNITSYPQFVDWNNNNYRLSASSPCVNTGKNQTWMTNSVDLDGRMRIRYGIVDMGAYETIYEGLIYRGF